MMYTFLKTNWANHSFESFATLTWTVRLQRPAPLGVATDPLQH